MHGVDRKINLLGDPLDQREVGKTRDEIAVCAGVGVGLSTLDRLIGKRHVMRVRLGLQEQVGAQIDEEAIANAGA